MDYILVFFAFGFGVGFHIMQKIMSLRVKFPELKFKQVWYTFFNEEWNVLMISILVMGVSEMALFIIRSNQIVTSKWFEQWGMYLIAWVLGYGGQRIAYKVLGTAESALTKKVDEIGK